jgi:hypothetical protein
MAREKGWTVKVRSLYSALAMLVGLWSLSGIETNPAFGQVFDKDLEIRVDTLPALVAPSKDPMDVLVTSLAIVFHDREICCGKDSALGDRVQTADPKSLKNVASKLNGRHLLSDGRPFVVTADYMAPDAVNSGTLIGMITAPHAGLMLWNAHLYVVNGLIYRWIIMGGDSTSAPMTVIHKLLLRDPRFTDERQKVEFNRGSDDIDKIGGFLFVQTELP